MILKKLGDEYKLYSHDSCIATTHESPYKKLSLKNCQAIENGYDLDELAYEYDLDTIENVYGQVKAFKTGFQKALEILGDKKFSEEDMEKCFNAAKVLDHINGCKVYRNFDSYLRKSLQQTEWDVEIEMEYQGFKKDYKPIEAYLPKLDADGCLILRRC